MPGDGLTKWAHNHMLTKLMVDGVWSLTDPFEAQELRRVAAFKRASWRKSQKASEASRGGLCQSKPHSPGLILQLLERELCVSNAWSFAPQPWRPLSSAAWTKEGGAPWCLYVCACHFDYYTSADIACILRGSRKFRDDFAKGKFRFREGFT